MKPMNERAFNILNDFIADCKSVDICLDEVLFEYAQESIVELKDEHIKMRKFKEKTKELARQGEQICTCPARHYFLEIIEQSQLL
jgi:ferredoxin